MLKKSLSGHLLFVSFLAILSTANAMDNAVIEENQYKLKIKVNTQGNIFLDIKNKISTTVSKIFSSNAKNTENEYMDRIDLKDGFFLQGNVLPNNRNGFLIKPHSLELYNDHGKMLMQILKVLAIEIFKYLAFADRKTNGLLSLLRPHMKHPGQEKERHVVPFLEKEYAAGWFLEWMLDNPLAINVILKSPEYEVIRTELKRHLIDKVTIKNRRSDDMPLRQHYPLNTACNKSTDSPYLRNKAIQILKSLDFKLSEINLQNDDGSVYQFICDSLKSTDSVHTLMLAIDRWSQESIQNIFKGRELFPNLKSLGIEENKITPEKWDDLYNLIKSKPTLEELEINACIRNKDCEPISKILSIRPLTSLKLDLRGRANIESNFFKVLVPFFTNNSSLRTLKVDFIEDHNASLLINALKNNSTLTNLSLHTNSTCTGYYNDQRKFCLIPVDTKLADDILVFLNHNTSLKSLTLSSYEVDSYPSNKLEELAQAIQKHPTLTHISLNEQVFERENSMPFSCILNLKWDPESEKVIKNFLEVPEFFSNLKNFGIIEQFSASSELWEDFYNFVNSHANIEKLHIEYDGNPIYKKNIIEKTTKIRSFSTLEVKKYDRYK